MKSWGYIIIMALLALTACSKEEYQYPSITTDLVDLQTDNNSNVKQILTDDGKVFVPNKIVKYASSTPDSTYRVRCAYKVLEETGNKISLYRINQIVSAYPVFSSYFENGIKTDPVKIISIWQSERYINLHIGLMTKGELHEVHFIKDEPVINASGTKTQHITFYHSQGNDPEGYTREAFLSCPLYNLGLQSNDSVIFSINTYDGNKSYNFIMK